MCVLHLQCTLVIFYLNRNIKSQICKVCNVSMKIEANLEFKKSKHNCSILISFTQQLITGEREYVLYSYFMKNGQKHLTNSQGMLSVVSLSRLPCVHVSLQFVSNAYHWPHVTVTKEMSPANLLPSCFLNSTWVVWRCYSQ